MIQFYFIRHEKKILKTLYDLTRYPHQMIKIPFSNKKKKGTMFCNRQKHIESKSIFYQSIVILFLLQNPSNKHNCVQISIKIIESSKKSSILQNLPSYIPFQSAAIDRWPRYATVASDLFSFQFHLFLFSRFVNNSRGGRGE